MLKAFGFITHVEHPHKLLLNYLQIIGLDVGMDRDEAEFPGFVQEAWNIANDRWVAALPHSWQRGPAVAITLLMATRHWWAYHSVCVSSFECPETCCCHRTIS